ncbi:MAG: peptide-methionine (S)-S-oxide reductase MsrA [Phenylobacterium sp.]|uniref:peptide-methionine (S)-S-oxide reductase MsrA n=1 Tax=Phenylobacterium sp. TaxID=1871053 RepID=UPI00391D79CD
MKSPRSARLAAAAAAVGALGLMGAAPAHRTAVFAGGCFWSVEHDLEHLPGVKDVVVGYAGGKRANPTYRDHAGHLEAVKVTYDPAAISYPELVDGFLHHIDPTDGGGQICDRGPSYRTAVFVASPQERQAAEAAKAKAARELKKPVATMVLPASRFWLAEGYHQDFARKNPVRYNAYRVGCGRDARLKAVWAGR